MKEWNESGSRTAYNEAKRVAAWAVDHAATEDSIWRKSILNDIYKSTEQMCQENYSVVVERPIKNDDSVLSLDNEAKKEAWVEHYQKLLNDEFPWNGMGATRDPKHFLSYI